MKTRILIIFCTFLSALSFSQNQYNKWYFGAYAALDFMNNPPTAIGGSQLAAGRGSASVADSVGNLLFYTDGQTVWNQSNQVMANGTALAPINNANYQNALIVKQPGSATLYYLFSMGTGAFPFRYAVIDMSLAAGMGSVTVKGVTLADFPQAGKLTGTRHCNGTDYWIVTRAQFPRVFYSYLLSASGLNQVPVVSSLGNDTITLLGEMKISPNGKRIAHDITKHIPSAVYRVAIHEFDNATGAVSSNSIVLSGFPDSNYFGEPGGVEFSPNGSKIYISTVSANTYLPKLYQFNLCAGSEQAINASKYIVYFDSTALAGGQLQLATNGKIYKSRYQSVNLGVINNPDLPGAACNYNNAGQSVSVVSGLASCVFGLPNFITSEMNVAAPTQFSFMAACQNVYFTGVPGVSADSYCGASSY